MSRTTRTDEIAGSIAAQLGNAKLVDELAGLTPSELTSLLLAVMRKQAAKRGFTDVRQQFERDIATQPSTADARALHRVERAFLEAAEAFDAVDIAPAAPLGLCSLTGIDQNLVLAAVRNLEVLADPTASLALEIARRRKSARSDVHLATTARVLRLAPLPKGVPHFSRHFRLHCLVSGGRGDSFVKDALVKHVAVWVRLLRSLGADEVRVRVTRGEVFEIAGASVVVDEERQQGRNYYDGVLLGIDVRDRTGEWFTPADGGSVAWTKALLSDEKERLVTSGFGAEYVVKRLGL